MYIGSIVRERDALFVNGRYKPMTSDATNRTMKY